MNRVRFLAFLAAVLTAVSACGCSGGKKNEYYSKSVSTEFGSLTVNLSYKTKSESGRKKAEDHSESELNEIFYQAVGAFERSAEFVSSNSTSSLLGEINSPVNAVFDCDDASLELLDGVCSLSEYTQGYFQPVCGALSALYSTNEHPTDDEVAAAVAHTGLEKIQVDSETKTVKKTDREATVDLYMMREGYALDGLIEYLESTSVSYGFAVLDGIAGVFGTRPRERSFDIGVYSDEEKGVSGYVRIKSGFVAVASEDVCPLLLNMTTGRPADSGLSRTVVTADSGWKAQALAQSFYAMSVDAAMKLYDDGKMNFEAAFIDMQGKITVTSKAMDALGETAFVTETSGEK